MGPLEASPDSKRAEVMLNHSTVPQDHGPFQGQLYDTLPMLAQHGPYLWDVDKQTGVGDIGDANKALLDDPLSLDLHTGHRCPGGQEKWWWPRAGMLSDVVDLLWGGDKTMKDNGGRQRRTGLHSPQPED